MRTPKEQQQRSALAGIARRASLGRKNQPFFPSAIRAVYAGLASIALVAGGMANAATPQAEVTIAEWAQDSRHLAPESGSPLPGKWLNETAPWLTEPMDELMPDRPGTEVPFVGCSQSGKTEIGQNWSGWTIDCSPAALGIYQPNKDTLKTFDETKLSPTINATPVLAARVSKASNATTEGSTARLKKFDGGFIKLGSAMTGADLQMISLGRVWCDEVAEYPEDTNGRGHPVDQARKRGSAYGEEFKMLLTSTAGIKDRCYITARYEAGDMRRRYHPCPDCGDLLRLEPDMLKWSGDEVVVDCPACGTEISEQSKPGMVARGHWVPTWEAEGTAAPPRHFPADDLAHWQGRRYGGQDAVGTRAFRHPSFRLWKAETTLGDSWTQILTESEKAGDDQFALRTYYQQTLALPYDEAGDAPDWEQLQAAQRIHEKAGRVTPRGVLPDWAWLVTGATDVQGNYLQGAAWAWGPVIAVEGDRVTISIRGQRIDHWQIMGDTLQDRVWYELADLIATSRYESRLCQPLGFDRFVIDSGGAPGTTPRVYDFCHPRQGVTAIKGASNAKGPLYQAGKIQKIKLDTGRTARAQVDFVNSISAKFSVYSMLTRMKDAAEQAAQLPGGSLVFEKGVAEETFRQVTAEYWKPTNSARADAGGSWQRIHGQPNEELDITVYNYALTSRLGLRNWTQERWEKLMEQRRKPVEGEMGPLEALMQREVVMAEDERPLPDATDETGQETPEATPPDEKQATPAPRAPSLGGQPGSGEGVMAALKRAQAAINGAG